MRILNCSPELQNKPFAHIVAGTKLSLLFLLIQHIIINLCLFYSHVCRARMYGMHTTKVRRLVCNMLITLELRCWCLDKVSMIASVIYILLLSSILISNLNCGSGYIVIRTVVGALLGDAPALNAQCGMKGPTSKRACIGCDYMTTDCAQPYDPRIHHARDCELQVQVMGRMMDRKESISVCGPLTKDSVYNTIHKRDPAFMKEYSLKVCNYIVV